MMGDEINPFSEIDGEVIRTCKRDILDDLNRAREE